MEKANTETEKESYLTLWASSWCFRGFVQREIGSGVTGYDWFDTEGLPQSGIQTTLTVAWIKCCMNQIQQVRSHSMTVGSADGVLYSWENFPDQRWCRYAGGRGDKYWEKHNFLFVFHITLARDMDSFIPDYFQSSLVQQTALEDRDKASYRDGVSFVSWPG